MRAPTFGHVRPGRSSGPSQEALQGGFGPQACPTPTWYSPPHVQGSKQACQGLQCAGFEPGQGQHGKGLTCTHTCACQERSPVKCGFPCTWMIAGCAARACLQDVASIVLLPPSWLDDDDGEDLLHQTHLAPVWQPLHDQGRHGSSLDAPLPAQGDAPRHHARARGSPAAFMRRIKACNNVGELDAVLSEQSLPVYYNVRHAAAALTHMAQLLTRQTQQPPQHHTEQSPQPPPLYTHVSQPLSSEPQAHVASSLVHRLVQRLWAGRHELQARQVANVTWALGALHPHTSPQSAVQLVTFLCDWAGRHTDEFQPQELSSMLHGLATFGVAPPSIAWVCGVLGAVERALPCMTPQGVANSVWALSHWLATAHTQVAAPHAADTAHALSDLAYDSSAPQHGAEWVGVGGWQVLVGKASARHVITHTLRDTLHTRAAVLMDAVWAVSGAHLPEGGCCPGPATVACSDSPWPVRTLVLVAWSCARMRVSDATGADRCFHARTHIHTRGRM